MGIVIGDNVIKILKGRAHFPVLREVTHQGPQEGMAVGSASIADDCHVAPGTGDGDVDPPVLSKETNLT